MSSRFLIPVLCIGAVAYACGPRTQSDAAGLRKTDGATTRVASAPTTKRPATTRKGPDRKPAIAARLTVSAEPTAIRLALHVVNTGNRRVEVNFPSGQTYDFVIVDSIGREVWHWGSGRMFTQTLRNRLLDGGESINVQETWTGALTPGRYTARGILKSENFPVTETAEFTVGTPTTVATREEP